MLSSFLTPEQVTAVVCICIAGVLVYLFSVWQKMSRTGAMLRDIPLAKTRYNIPFFAHVIGTHLHFIIATANTI